MAEKDFRISRAAMTFAFVELHDAAKLSGPLVLQAVCSAVANLIAGSGPAGSAQQEALMNIAERIGFKPEYYGRSIRVSWEPPPA